MELKYIVKFLLKYWAELRQSILFHSGFWSWVWSSCHGTLTPQRTAARLPSTSVTSSSFSVCGWLLLCLQQKRGRPPRTSVSELQPKLSISCLHLPPLSEPPNTVAGGGRWGGLFIKWTQRAASGSDLRSWPNVKEAHVRVCRRLIAQWTGLHRKRWSVDSQVSLSDA